MDSKMRDVGRAKASNAAWCDVDFCLSFDSYKALNKKFRFCSKSDDPPIEFSDFFRFTMLIKRIISVEFVCC